MADPTRPLRVLHAPNHRSIKGTEYVVAAVETLAEEGLAIELVLVQGVPNRELLATMATCDVVVDQLIIGWYAMFALEGMAAGRAVVCFLRDDLLTFYRDRGLLGPDDPPLISARPSTIADELRRLCLDRDRVASYGARGPDFVARHHSLPVVGGVLAEIVSGLGVCPRPVDESADAGREATGGGSIRLGDGQA